MQQREPRLGDILDDYCPRERRVTNHAVVAMVGADVKQTRCTTCDAEHEYKHARIPRQRRKSEAPAALYSQVLAGGPKKVAHEPAQEGAEGEPPAEARSERARGVPDPIAVASAPASPQGDPDDEGGESSPDVEEGPVHRQLIRATLPRQEGQPPPPRPAPEFTLRQPAGRHGRFRPRHQRDAVQFQGNRSGNSTGGGGPRQGGGRSPMMSSRPGKRHGPGRKRSK
jgi:hypothetical protein